MPDFQTLQELIAYLAHYDPLKPIICWHGRQQRCSLTLGEFLVLVQDYSRGFLALGLKPGDRVAVFSDNHPLWLVLTLAINNAGLVDVPRGENATPDEINYILEHSKAQLVLIADQTILTKIRSEQKKTSKYKIYSIESTPNIQPIQAIAALGAQSTLAFPVVRPSDTASIIYTSGTTGIPKGVELTQRNFASQIAPILERVSLLPTDKCLSILPAWHAFERVIKYITLASGIETFYTTQKDLMDDLQNEQPTLLASVPRIWEVIYERIMKKLKKGSPWRKTLLNFACSASISYVKAEKAYHPVQLLKAPIHHLLDRSLYAELRKRLGGRLRFAVSGGSALPNYIDDFFNAASVEILEGYGLTETSPVLSVRIPGGKALFSAGTLISGIEAKIVDPENGRLLADGHEGVLYVRGPNVMKGYYRNFEETKRVLDSEGWLDTGDRAYFDHNKNIVITGREKDLIVLSNGENVNPVPIEIALTKSDYINAAIVTGQDWRHLTALIVPDLDHLRDLCARQQVVFNPESLHEVFNLPLIYDFYRKEIMELINPRNGFKTYERIHDFRFAQPFNVGRELTMTMKPKRALIEQLYKAEIASMRQIS